MLKFSVHNVTVIDELLPLLSRLRDWKTGIEILQNAFDYFRTKYPHGPPSAPLRDRDVDWALQALSQSQDDVEAPFRDVHIVALADYYLHLHYYDKAILTIRNGARWLQGRRMEIHWEGLPDDREFNLDPGLRKGDGLLSGGPGAGSGMHPLDVNMRHRLARARIKMGDHDEGKVCAPLSQGQYILINGRRATLDACRYRSSRGPCALWRAVCGVGRCVCGTGTLCRCAWDLLCTFRCGPGTSNSSLRADPFCNGRLQVTVEVAMQAGLCHQRLGKLEEAQSLFECSEN